MSNVHARRTLSWTRVSDARAFGVVFDGAGYVGAGSASKYFVWIQACPLDDGRYYAGARVTGDGFIERYRNRYSSGVEPPPGIHGAWLCDEGTLSDAKAACELDHVRRLRTEST